MTCPDCTRGSFLEGEPTGRLLDDGPYFAEAATASTSGQSSRRAVVVLMDAFGLASKNNKILADQFAQRLGCNVYVPDIFAGRPLFGINDMKFQETADHKFGIIDWLKMIWAMLPNLGNFIRSRPSVVDARLDRFFKALKEENKYDKIGAVGYSFGGKIAVRLGSKDWVNSVVIAHPVHVSDAQIKAIKVSAAWICAENDFAFPKKQRLSAEAEFAARTTNKVDYEFVEYKGTAHGFAIRPSLHIPTIKDAFERSMDQTVNWFNKTL